MMKLRYSNSTIIPMRTIQFMKICLLRVQSHQEVTISVILNLKLSRSKEFERKQQIYVFKSRQNSTDKSCGERIVNPSSSKKTSGYRYFKLLTLEFKQQGSKSEHRLEKDFREVYQNHLREVKNQRKRNVTDKKLIRFNATKNPDIFYNFEKRLDSRLKEKTKQTLNLRPKMIRKKKINASKYFNIIVRTTKRPIIH
jgi:hypothetical protein